MSLTRSQYNRIMDDYSARRRAALRRHEEKMTAIRSEIPEYARLEDESTAVAARYAHMFIDDPTISLDDMDRELRELSDRRSRLLADHGYATSDTEVIYSCPDCQDTGYIEGRKCHCLKQAQLEILYDRSNLRDMIATDNFDTLREDLFEGEDLVHYREAVRVAHEFADRFDEEYSNLMLYGTVGTGKSFLCSAIARQLLDTGHSVIYFSASDFFKIYGDIMFGRGEDRDDEDTVSDCDDIYNCDLLVLDDLGTEMSGQYTCSALFNCLNNRHNRRRSTIINTNLALPDLHARYSDRVFSRLTGYYKILKLTGPDLRLKMSVNLR